MENESCIHFDECYCGMVIRSGFAYDQSCVYINGTGRDFYEFYIQLNRCGTLGGDTHNLDSRKQPTVRKKPPDFCRLIAVSTARSKWVDTELRGL